MTIEYELRRILSYEVNQAAIELNLLIDQFREGRDPWELLCLLNSDDDELISNGAYIINEISFDWYNTPAFIDKLHELTHHESPTIRFWASGALFPSLDRTNPDTLELINRLLKDDNDGVRMSAEAAANRLGIN